MIRRGSARVLVSVVLPILIALLFVVPLIVPLSVAADAHTESVQTDADVDALLASLDSPELQTLLADTRVGLDVVERDRTTRYVVAFDESGIPTAVVEFDGDPVSFELTTDRQTIDTIAASPAPEMVAELAVQNGAIAVGATDLRSSVLLGAGTLVTDADTVYRYVTRVDADRRTVELDLTPDGEAVLDGFIVPVEGDEHHVILVHRGAVQSVVASEIVTLDDPDAEPLDVSYYDPETGDDRRVTIGLTTALDRAAVTVYEPDGEREGLVAVSTLDAPISSGVDPPIGETMRLGLVGLGTLAVGTGVVAVAGRVTGRRRASLEQRVPDGTEAGSLASTRTSSLENTETTASTKPAGTGTVATSRSDVLAASSADEASDNLRSVQLPPVGRGPCEEIREQWADMLSEAETGAADAATAAASAEAAQAEAAEAKSAAAEAAETAAAAEAALDAAKDELAAAEENKAGLPERVADAQQAVDEAEEQLEIERAKALDLIKQKSHFEDRARATSGQQARDYRTSADTVEFYRRQQREKTEAAREALNEAEAELEALEAELAEAQAVIDAAEEAVAEAQAEADAASNAAETAAAEAEAATAAAEAATAAAEAAAEHAEALLAEAKAFAEQYAECIEGFLEALEERAEEAADRAREAAERAREARRRAAEKADDGDRAGREAYPDGDPVGAARGHYDEGRKAVSDADRAAREAQESADEAERAAEAAEELAELLEEIRRSGAPGASEVPSGSRTRRRTARDARTAGGRSTAAGREADRASEVFSECTPPDSEHLRDVVEETWELDDSRSVDYEFTSGGHEGAMEHTARGTAAERAQQGMAAWLRNMAHVLGGDREALVEELVSAALEELEFDDPAEKKATKEELADAINKMLDSKDVEIKKLGGIVGIPAQWFAALLSAGSQLLTAAQIEEVKERARSYEPGTLIVYVPVVVTERSYRVEKICVNGRWITRRVRTGERRYSRIRSRRFDNITDSQVPDYVARGIELVKNSGESGQTKVER